MSDRPQSIAPPPPSHLDWEEDAAFRHVFLFRFDEPDRATLRRLGEMLYRYVLETAIDYGPDLQDAPPIAAELAAGAADLRTLWGFFRSVEVEDTTDHAGRSGASLKHLAGTMAQELTRLAERLEGELS
jgi:hypothetical protein